MRIRIRVFIRVMVRAVAGVRGMRCLRAGAVRMMGGLPVAGRIGMGGAMRMGMPLGALRAMPGMLRANAGGARSRMGRWIVRVRAVRGSVPRHARAGCMPGMGRAGRCGVLRALGCRAGRRRLCVHRSCAGIRAMRGVLRERRNGHQRDRKQQQARAHSCTSTSRIIPDSMW